MLKPITEKQRSIINNYLKSMTLEEKVGQVQCVSGGNLPSEKIKDLVLNKKIGSLFAGNVEKEEFKAMHEASKYAEIPVINCGDLVNGAGSRMFGTTRFPQQMACAATHDEELMEKMGEITATEARAYGAHWTFAPVVDLCYNKDNPMMHVRTSGDDPQHVLEVSRAYMRGVQKDGLMAATAKHFPGDGTDSRDTHITTLVNDFTREEWEKTYGVIWRGMIEAGVMSVMSGHIALPFIDPCYEDEAKRYKGMRPASLSKKILIDFLRGELGFQGTIVTDAINMVGLGAHIPRKDYGWKLLEAGNDMLLWTIPDLDTPEIIKAIEDGRLTMERLDDAVKHVLELKARVGLFEDEVYYPEITQEQFKKNQEIAQLTADKSITIVRDVFNSVPFTNLKPGSKVLTVTATYVEGTRNGQDKDDLVVIDEELKKRGIEVDHLVNPPVIGHINKIVDNYDAVFVNFKYPPRYGTIRLYGDAINLFKGSWWVDNPKVIFTAFGDPYKIYDLPSLHCYINAYSTREVSQVSAVKVWLGEIEAVGKSPIDLSGLV